MSVHISSAFQQSHSHFDIACDEIRDDLPRCRRRSEIEGEPIVRTAIPQHGKLLGEINQMTKQQEAVWTHIVLTRYTFRRLGIL